MVAIMNAVMLFQYSISSKLFFTDRARRTDDSVVIKLGQSKIAIVQRLVS